jgi:predicted metalloprotease with PDZ domain
MKRCFLLFLSIQLAFLQLLLANDTVYFKIDIVHPKQKIFQVSMTLENRNVTDELLLQLPIWSPGYYQIMSYPDRVSNFQVYDQVHRPLKWEKTNHNTWHINTEGNKSIIVNYNVQADKSFVAENKIDSAHAYIIPTATFLYPEKDLNRPIIVQIHKDTSWTGIATGLQLIEGKQDCYFANNYDILFDSPLLVGTLTTLPTFYIKGTPHHFYAYDLKEGNYQSFSNQLQKIVQTASDLIGHIPYADYTFIGIGKGQGGIEHLNSTTVSLESIPEDAAQRKQLLSFLTHEYFHHYNAKRIRPIELGPFDYTRANTTKQLWIAEGITVYYEGIIMNRAGIISKDELLQRWAKEINDYESNPGKKHQSLADASEKTWEEGPFGSQEGRGISYYQKGPVIALLLDLKIRHATSGRKSLDDVMRMLYTTYYQHEKRGFTEEEFRTICERVAGANLQEIFDYVYTTKPLNYQGFFDYVGLLLTNGQKGVKLTQQPNSNKKQRTLLAHLVY